MSSISDIMSGIIPSQRVEPAASRDTAAGMPLREIIRAEINPSAPAAQATPDAAQAAPVVPEQDTGGILNTMDTRATSVSLTDMVKHTASMLDGMGSQNAAVMNALSTGQNMSAMIQRHFGGLENTPEYMADAGAATADLNAFSEKFRTAGELSLSSTTFNANLVGTLIKNSG